MYPILTDAAKRLILDGLASEPDDYAALAADVDRAAVGTDVTDHALYPPHPDGDGDETWLESIITYFGIDRIADAWR